MEYSLEVSNLIERQLRDWDTVKKNYGDLVRVKLRSLRVGLSSIVLQFNPERLRSSAAKVDAATLKARACFLCSEHQPREQEAVIWQERYKIQVNPYPIFPLHLTVASLEHTPQRMAGRVGDLLQLAHDLPGFVLFYNGPKCGASAPDHMHFQAGNQGFMPFVQEVGNSRLAYIDVDDDGFLALSHDLARRAFLIKSRTVERATSLFNMLQQAMPLRGDDDEPMQNVLCWWNRGAYGIIVFPRRKHRPACYGSGENQFLISPASVDMGGMWAVPVEKDFLALTAQDVQHMYDELCMTQEDAIEIITNLNKKI